MQKPQIGQCDALRAGRHTQFPVHEDEQKDDMDSFPFDCFSSGLTQQTGSPRGSPHVARPAVFLPVPSAINSSHPLSTPILLISIPVRNVKSTGIKKVNQGICVKHGIS